MASDIDIINSELAEVEKLQEEISEKIAGLKVQRIRMEVLANVFRDAVTGKTEQTEFEFVTEGGEAPEPEGDSSD